MKQKQVVYFYEGETERKLLEFLKDAQKIKPGKLKKFNLWTNPFKSTRLINKGDVIIFVIDTDKMNDTDIFKKNIKLLKPYNICLIVQHKNLEDELCHTCSIKDIKVIYDSQNIDQFKNTFIKDKNIENTLTKNDFNFNKLWVRDENFNNFLSKNHIEANNNCRYKL